MTTNTKGMDELFDSSGDPLALGGASGVGGIASADWELIEKVTDTAVASLDAFWTGGVFEEIEVTFEIELANDLEELELRLSEDGSTFLSGASDYEFVNNIDQNRAGGSIETEGDGNDHMQLALNIGNDSNGGASGQILISRLTSSFKTYINHQGTYLDSDASQGTINSRTAGTRTGTGTSQGVQLLSSVGNISGTMIVRGRRVTPLVVLSKAPVRAASVANVDETTELENGDTLDGVTLATDDRVLLKDQTDASENGIYVVVVSGAASRSDDMSADGDLIQGVLISVAEGTNNAASVYMLTTAGPFTIDTTNLTFAWTGVDIGTITLDLGSARYIDSNDIPNAETTGAFDASGGLLAVDTTPSYGRLNGATDKALRVNWVNTNVDEIQFEPIFMPPDLDSDQDVTIHILGRMDGGTDTATAIDVQVFDGIGDTEMGGLTTPDFTASLAEVTVTITAANITGHPLGFFNISLVPEAHGTDDLQIFAVWIEYAKKQS